MTAEPLWAPSDSRRREARMTTFAAAASERHGLDLHDHESLFRWSVRHPEQFWPFVAEHFGIDLAPGEVVRGTPPETVWFPGARLNVAHELLRRGADADVALVALDDAGRAVELSFAELRARVGGLVQRLRRLGVSAGDVVTAYVANDEVAVIAMLATAWIGAVFASAPVSLGVPAALDRFAPLKPRVLVGAESFVEGGKVHASIDRVQELAERLGPDVSMLTSSDLSEEGSLDEPELFPFDHPVYVLFSSGTTGKPKGLVHRAGGVLLKHLVEQALHCDLRRGDRLFFHTTPGWMMWNWQVSALALGATVVLYQGSAVYPSLMALFEITARHHVSHFGCGAFILENMKRLQPGAKVDLTALRCLMATGSPLSAATFRWIYAKVKTDLHVASISGGTDIAGCFFLGNPTAPVFAGELQTAALGCDPDVVDERGDSLTAGIGELVCRNAIPSMPLAFWGDDATRSLYRSAYFARFPDVWTHGDLVERTPSGGVVVHGRSDAVLKPGGVRVGTSEIYAPLQTLGFVAEALAAGKRESDGDTSIWLFVVLRDGLELTPERAAEIRQCIRAYASETHVPRRIHQVKGLPRTHNAKLMEVLVGRLLDGRDEEVERSLASVSNPESVQEIRALLPPPKR